MTDPFRDNPTRVLVVNVDPAAPGRDAALAHVARQIVPSWTHAVEPTVAPVHGGITNQLFLLRSGDLEPVLVRVYGTNTEVVIDRETENSIFAELSRRGFAPTYHGRFQNGRVEGWCEGFRALEPPELGLPHMRRLIAPGLRTLHGFPPPTADSKLWTTLCGWMATARSVAFDGDRQALHDLLQLERYDGYLSALRRHERDVIAPNATSPGARLGLRPVLAHNDLLAGNVLTNAAQDQVRFIDYEYGATAPAAFDVANHFCEYAGFDSDFVNGFPPRADRDDFIAAYLGADATPADVSDFSRLVEFYVLPDHLWWGTWAVVQARHSPIDFDYLEYARLRLAGFDLHLGQLGFDLG